MRRSIIDFRFHPDLVETVPTSVLNKRVRVVVRPEVLAAKQALSTLWGLFYDDGLVPRDAATFIISTPFRSHLKRTLFEFRKQGLTVTDQLLEFPFMHFLKRDVESLWLGQEGLHMDDLDGRTLPAGQFELVAEAFLEKLHDRLVLRPKLTPKRAPPRKKRRQKAFA